MKKHEIISVVKEINCLSERSIISNKLEDVSCVREQIIKSLQDENKSLKNEFFSVIDDREFPESQDDNTDEVTLKIINEDADV